MADRMRAIRTRADLRQQHVAGDLEDEITEEEDEAAETIDRGGEAQCVVVPPCLIGEATTSWPA